MPVNPYLVDGEDSNPYMDNPYMADKQPVGSGIPNGGLTLSAQPGFTFFPSGHKIDHAGNKIYLPNTDKWATIHDGYLSSDPGIVSEDDFKSAEKILRDMKYKPTMPEVAKGYEATKEKKDARAYGIAHMTNPIVAQKASSDPNYGKSEVPSWGEEQKQKQAKPSFVSSPPKVTAINPYMTQDTTEEDLEGTGIKPVQGAIEEETIDWTDPNATVMPMMLPGGGYTIISRNSGMEYPAAIANAPAQAGLGAYHSVLGLARLSAPLTDDEQAALDRQYKKASRMAQMLTPSQTGAKILNFAAKMPFEIAKFASVGAGAPVLLALESASGKYMEALQGGANEREAALAAGINGAVAGAIGIIPGGEEARDIAGLALGKLLRGFVIGGAFHSGGSAATWVYNPSEAARQIKDPAAWVESIATILAYEGSGVAGKGKKLPMFDKKAWEEMKRPEPVIERAPEPVQEKPTVESTPRTRVDIEKDLERAITENDRESINKLRSELSSGKEQPSATKAPFDPEAKHLELLAKNNEVTADRAEKDAVAKRLKAEEALANFEANQDSLEASKAYRKAVAESKKADALAERWKVELEKNNAPEPVETKTQEVVEPAKPKEDILVDQLGQQDEITRLREQRVEAANALELAKSDLEVLRQEGRRGKSEVWQDANARVAKATADLVKVNEDLSRNTGKTLDTVGPDGTIIPGELQGEPSGVTPEGMNKPRPEIPADIATAMGLDIGPAKRTLARSLELDANATWPQISQEIISRIGRLGSSIKETAIRIINKIKGIGRDVANAIAAHLHKVDAELKAMEDENGVVTLHSEVGDTSAKAIREEWESNIKIISDPAARARLYKLGPPKQPNSAIVKPSGPTGTELLEKSGSNVEFGDWLRKLEREATGAGVFNEDGSKRIVMPDMEYDPKLAAASAKREMNVADRVHGKFGSPSHTYTTFGGWFADSPGVMKMGNNPATDIRIAEMSSFGNTLYVRAHLETELGKLGIEWLKSKDALYKELAPAREAHAEAKQAAERAKKQVSNGSDEAVAKVKLAQADQALKIANANLDSAIMGTLSKPEQSGARVMLGADYIGRGRDLPEWLKLSDNEVKAVDIINKQILEFKRVMEQSGIPVRDDFGVPHYFLPGLERSTQRSLRDYASLNGELSLNPDNIKFMHRSEEGRITIPDLGLLLEDYVARANYMIAKKAVAVKWNTAAADIITDKKHLAAKIISDMKDYTEGSSNALAWMDDMNRVFATVLTGLRTSTAVKHAMKFPLELAHGRPVSNYKGYREWRGALKGDPSLKQAMDALTIISKGPRYNRNPDIGVGETPLDRPTNMWQEIENATHFPMQWVEGSLRGATFKIDIYGAYNRGLTPKQALADVLFRKLMANFEATDKPVIMRTPMGRSLLFLQQTVTKIMELNIRSGLDLAKSVTRRIGEKSGGEPISPEENARYQQSYRHMLALATIALIGQKTNTPIYEWVTETPIYAKVIKAAVEIAAKKAYSKATGKKMKQSTNVGSDLYGGLPPILPLVAQAIESSKKYGTLSDAFVVDTFTPGFLKDVIIEPRGEQHKKWGRGEVARFRKLTGLYKEHEAIKLKEKYDKQDAKKQKEAAKKYMKSLKPGPRFSLDDREPE